MLYSQVGSLGDSALLSNSTKGTLQSTQGPCLSLPLSPAAAPSKCQHLFSMKRVIVSVKKKEKKNPSYRSPLNTWKETSTPPLCLIESNGRWKWEQGVHCTWQTSSCEACYERRLWIHATISHNCTEAFPFLLKNLFASQTISRRNHGALDSLDIDPQGQNRQFTSLPSIQ